MPGPILNIFLLPGMLKNRLGSISAARFDHGPFRELRRA